MSKISPIKRPKSKARRYYDRISGVYDWITASEKNLIKRGVNLLSPSPGERILEIGSGTGTALAFMDEKLTDQGCMVGLDLSRKMLDQSQKKTQALATPTYHLQADGAHLPLRMAQFDGVFCSFTLELFSVQEIALVLQEIKRVLQPSGRLAVVALAQKPRNLAVRLYELAHRLFPVAIDCRPIPLIKLLKENGFEIKTTSKTFNWGLPVHITLCQPL